MAITLAKGTSILIKLGDGGGGSEVFAHPCMINTDRSITFDGATTADNVEDCENPDNPAKVFNFKASRSIAIEGAGKLDAGDIDTYVGLVGSPDPTNAKLYVGATLIATVPLMFTKFAITGTNHKNAEASVSAVSHGWGGE